MSFTEYTTPAAHCAFSQSFFDSLTFAQTVDLVYPRIAPAGSVTHQEFTAEEPRSGSATVILPNEVLPNICDLSYTLRHMKEKFNDGMRSVVIGYTVQDVHYLYTFKLSKINLIRLACNHQRAVESARALVEYLGTSTTKLTLQSNLDDFCASPILSSIKGFFVTKFRLWELGCFLDENWVQDDVLDALLELIYFRLHASTATKHIPVQYPPTSLVLPLSFLSDAYRLYYTSSPRVFSPELLNIRRRIRETAVKVVAMPYILDNHFAAYVYRPGCAVIEHGDSLHNPPSTGILELLKWVFADTSSIPITTITSGEIAKQGGHFGGHGSCGIAVVNFIECALNNTITPWSGVMSRTFRDGALEDLIRYHHFTTLLTGKDSESGSWVDRACQTMPSSALNKSVGLETQVAYGYNDFNMFNPKALHPIYAFVTAPQTALATIIRPKKFLPLVSSLPSVPVTCPTVLEDPLLLPAFVLRPKEEPTDLDELVDSDIADPVTTSLTTVQISPMKPARKRRGSRTTSAPVNSKRVVVPSSSPEISVFSPSVNNKKIAVSQHRNEQHIIDLCSPDATPCKQEAPSTPTKCESMDFIDLCTPEPARVKHEHRHPQVETVPRGPSVQPAPGVVRVGSVFDSWQTSRDAIYTRENRLGYQWRIAQSKTYANGERKKVTVRCNRYSHSSPKKTIGIDPSDFRKGKSGRTDCEARVNINRIENSPFWQVTLTHFEHNHPPLNPAAPIRRLPTAVEKATISQLATSTSQTFNRGQIASILRVQHPDQPYLEPRQIGNIINNARKTAREEVVSLGGDISAIIKSLEAKNQESPGWRYHIMLDDTSTVTGVWWQSPLQAELTQQYGDILINDSTYNRNQNGYPLNIGIVIDGHGCSRNAWYSIQAAEDSASHAWALKNHVDSAGYPPTTVISDRHGGLISSVSETIPTANHFFCIHHLDGNVDQNLRRTVGARWQEFKGAFWTAYFAISPDEFDRLWAVLTAEFPSAQKYLDEELYPCRRQWAWAWTSVEFTCGVRTSGRIEGENRVNKVIGGPKKSLKQLFDGLNERTDGQGINEMIRVRDSSRRQHPSQIETIFTGPLDLIRQFAGPFALQTCYQQMEHSVFYRTEVLQRPAGLKDWNEYAIQINPADVGFSPDKEAIEGKHMLNKFDNDSAYISTKWLLRLTRGRGLHVVHLLRIIHRGTGKTHMLAILQNNTYMCDCCMGMNLGVPCRHYFQALTVVKNFNFDLKVIRTRWLQDKNMDFGSRTVVTSLERQEGGQGTIPATAPALDPPATATSDMPHTTPAPPASQTIPARTVYHESQAAMRRLMTGVQTQEQLDELLDGLNDLRSSQLQSSQIGPRDPPVLNLKGRPRTQRLTGATEGRARGGGANIHVERRAARKCGVCRQEGHTRPTCPYEPRGL